MSRRNGCAPRGAGAIGKGLRAGLAAGLIAGAAPTGLEAQESVKPASPAQRAPAPRLPPAPPDPPASPQAAADPAEPGKQAEPPEMEFTGPDGEPLPPEKQRELGERFKNDLPPPASRKPSPGPGDREIVVTGQRPRGSVVGNIPAAQEFDPHDIRAFGANDIGELLQALGPQLGSGRGREDNGPVVLLNGKRVSSFAEIFRIPTEAIERMEVFPEELALKYGYRADQKVVNIVTYESFASRIGQVSYSVPTEGGRDTAGLAANLLRISRDMRINLDADYNRSGALLESERTLLEVAPGSARSRTLLPRTRRVTLNGTVSGEWLGGVSTTLNGRFDANESESLLGVGPVGPLGRDVDTRAVHLGTAFGGSAGKWLWSLTGNYDRTRVGTFTDGNGAPGVGDEAQYLDSRANADLLLSGTVLNLPAGPAAASLRAAGETLDFSSRSRRGGVEQRVALSRDTIGMQASLDLPIASRSRKSLASLGDLSANVNLALDQLSDFGTLRTIGYGLSWSPVPAIHLIASATHEEGAPTVQQLGAPLVVTPGVRTFDFARREVIDVTRTFGGNPGLRSDDRDVFKIGLNAKPLSRTDLTISIDYIKTAIDDPIAGFPVATPAIEAAFPERFARDADGRLLRIDGTPLNFARSDQEKLRWGVNFTRPLGRVPPEMRNAKVRFVGSGADLQNALPPGARIITPPPGSAGAKRHENMSSRLTLSLYHNVNLVDEILVREGGPTLDLLNGSPLDARGGRPRHELEFQAAAFKQGLGARVKINWQSGTVVRGLSASPAAGSGMLTFASHATVNVNLFANLADRFGGAKAPDWLKGARVSLGINNLFDHRPEVRDEAGLTPLSYQPAYLDPQGRLLSFSVRKVF